MPIPITMPRLSDTMEEGTLVSWKVKVGDKVESGDHLADVETDKATMELQAFDDGTVAKLVIDEGATVPIETTICVLAEEGEDVEEAAKSAEGSGDSSPVSESESKSKDEEKGEDEDEDKDKGEGEDETKSKSESKTKDKSKSRQAPEPEPDEAPPSDRKLRISPLARKLADEHGLDVKQIKGTGPDGRIIKRDVLKAAESGATPAPEKREKDKAAATTSSRALTPASAAAVNERAVAALGGPTLEARTIPLSQMRKTIAKRLVESKTTVPHFQVSVAINMDPLMALRQTLNAQLESQGIKLSVNDFITRAVALAATQHPEVNSSWNETEITVHGTVNVGVAISLPAEKGGGLVVATLRDAHLKGLRQISSEVRELADKARNAGLSLDEMAESTITISNLGMPQYGVTQFTAIINPPTAAILAIGAALQQPVVRDGELTVGHQMNVTLSGDHRVIDGAQAAEYLTTLRNLLENPAGLLV
jgi:pyruvate dehydrogenase E2 component (dihydrolipoamide acetyltransferase)